jgi:hypothetical protein|tara:strand:+ start:350 stop:4381 length:4032 start_codon:yes stop_codon:yes gene_type:complete
MAKLSLGDYGINTQVADNSLGLGYTLEEMIEKGEKKYPSIKTTEQTITANPSINNAIAIQRNQDGSLKYTFDNIYDNKQLVSVAKDYYTNRDGKVYDDKEAVDEFISDRTWNQANTLTMGKEFAYVTGDNITGDQKSRLSYLTRYWDELPNFYEEGGRGASGFFANLGVGILDPINIIGAGVGGIVAKGVFKKAGQEVIKSQVKKGIAKKTVSKEILNSPEQLAKLSATAKRNALIKGSGAMALVDGAGFGTIDIANQTVEKEIDLRQTIDPIRTGTIALTAGGLGFFVGVAGGWLGNKIVNLRLAKNAELPTKNLKNASKKSPDNTKSSEALNSGFKIGSFVRTNLADQWDFVKVLQKEITGVEGDVATLKKLYKSGKFKSDPILEPYFQLRTLAAASTRAHSFIMEGVYIPPGSTARMASYTKGKSKGLHEVLKPFDKTNEVNEFLSYIAAKRQVAIARRRPKLDKTLPMEKALRREYIDFAEMDAAAYKNKYGVTLTRKTNFKNAVKDFKQFTDELLDYQVASGLVTKAEAKKILKENPFFIPLTRDRKVTLPAVSALKEQTQKIFRLARPAKKEIAKRKLEGDINLYQNMVRYTYQTVLSSDRNRAKLSFYNMLAKGTKLNPEKYGNIALRVKGNRFFKYSQIANENVKKAYEKAGAKFTVKSAPDKLDILTHSNTFRPTEGANFVDVVYRNGKAEMYEIMDPNMAEVFKGLGESGASRVTNMFFGEKSLMSRYARIASQAITYSPPFVAFNILRDTLAGAIHSAFGIRSSALRGQVGYIPGWTSGKGYISSIRQTQAYKEALLNGMGYSSRSETEALQPRSIAKMIENGSRLDVPKEVTQYYTKTLKNFIGKPAGYGWQQYRKVVQSAEYATRMGEFQLAKAAGFSDIGAAFAGREVATDFGMRGSSATLNLLNRNTMFLNASIQGLYRTGRVFFEQPARAAALVGATIVAPEIALYHINSRYKEYSQVPSQVRQLNYLIPNFTTNEKGETVLDPDLPFYAMPKPYDLGIFANVAVGLMDGMYKGSDGVTKKYVAESFQQITPGLPIPTGLRPFIEMAFNKNFYSGAPVIGLYERQRLDELQARPSTREIATKLSNWSSNLSAFLLRKKEGTVKNPIFTPIDMDYLIGAYFTGILQYPFDVLSAQLDRPPLTGERPIKREDEADFSSFKNALSVVTRRFKVAAPIKNSQYHRDWNDLIQKAKKLKQIDFSQMDLKKTHETRLIGLFGRIEEKLKEGHELGVEPEVIAFSKISDILKTTQQLLLDSRKERNLIATGPLDAETKKEILDTLIEQENDLLKITIDTLSDMDIEYIFDQTYKMSVIFGTAEDAVKKNPREKK